MKNNYKGFRGWLNYIRDYKDNIDNDLIKEQMLIDANRQIGILNVQIGTLCKQDKEKDDIIKKLNLKIIELKEKLSDTKQKEHNWLISLDNLEQSYVDLQNKLEEKELLRRKCAGQVGGLKAKISVLKKDLARANQKINWLSNNQKAPSKEEIQAYDLQMKEVEKRQKSVD